MSNDAMNDEERLAELVREAGAPHAAPDPRYAEQLRATILDRLARAEEIARSTDAAAKAVVVPLNTIALKRTKNMRRVARIAVAATVLAAIGFLVCWLTIGGSANVAFAQVAAALDSLRSATFDVTSESKTEDGQPAATATGKGYFLAPSHQRMETATELDKNNLMKQVAAATTPGAKATAEAMMNMLPIKQIMIIDGESGKSIMLSPDSKIAIAMDMKKMREDMKKSAKLAKDPPYDQFEMVRRIVREGSSGTGDKVESLGKKEIDGREAVGFRTRANMMDMTLWADPGTARPIRIEIGMEMGAGGVVLVMSNFCYDVNLDPSLFSLEPPEGYSTQTLEATMPVEADLFTTLRAIAEHNNGMFPAKLAMTEEVMKALAPAHNPVMNADMDAAMNAAMEKVAARYGGKEGLQARYGKDKKLPPEIMAEIMAEVKKATAPFTQKQSQEDMKTRLPLQQRLMQGVTFYMMLKPENDPHYVGGGVKLGTPECPILWYKPTGAENYRVIYADLSVKDLTADEVQQLPQAASK
jgi:outer membrane lipoprotein-sorting protein